MFYNYYLVPRYRKLPFMLMIFVEPFVVLSVPWVVQPCLCECKKCCQTLTTFMQRYLFFTLCWMSTKCQKMSKISIRAKICLNPSKYTRILALIFDFTFIIQIISTFFHVEKWLFFRMKFLNLVHFVWSLSQAAQRPVIRFDEGSNHGSDCRR